MHKPAFYSKLAITNLKHNKSTYIPYLLACITSIITFYTLLAINFNDGISKMRGDTIVRFFTQIGTFIMGIFCIILIFYTNSFLIKRRKQELGLYSILGMEKKNIGFVMFFETAFIGGISLVLGLIGGSLLAQLLYLLLLRLAQFPVMLDLPVSFKAMGITTVFFGIIFLLTLFSNLRQVHLVNPIELLAGSKQGEKEPKASVLVTLVGVVSLSGGYWLAISSKEPLATLYSFLVAIVLVIIGTYCLFSSGSIAVLKALRKNKKYYYTRENFIPVSGMLYRMKQNAAGLASICILSCMVLVTVSSTVSLYFGAEDTMKREYPYDFTIHEYEHGLQLDLLPHVEKVIEEENIPVYDFTTLRFYTVGVHQSDTTKFEELQEKGMNMLSQYTFFQFFPLEDYNKLENTAFSLESDEVLIFANGNTYSEPTITLQDRTFKAQYVDSWQGQKNEQVDIVSSMVVILPTIEDVEEIGAVLSGADADRNKLQYTISFNTDIGRQEQLDLSENLKEMVIGEEYNGVRVKSIEDVREGYYLLHGSFLFLGVYFGLLFLLAAAMIIYYKQISEGYDDRERFIILQKVGMSQGEVWLTIRKQIRSVFFLPLMVAVIHIAVAFFSIRNVMVVFGISNILLLIVCTVITIVIYALVYWGVYRHTAKAYYKIVRRET